MFMRLVACEAGNVHIIGPCPNCYSAQGGLLFGTVASTYKGRVHTVCLDCDMTVDYYTDAKEEKLWRLESVETKGSQSSAPQIKAKKSEEVDTAIKTEKSEAVDTAIKAEKPEAVDTDIKAEKPGVFDPPVKPKEPLLIL